VAETLSVLLAVSCVVSYVCVSGTAQSDIIVEVLSVSPATDVVDDCTAMPRADITRYVEVLSVVLWSSSCLHQTALVETATKY